MNAPLLVVAGQPFSRLQLLQWDPATADPTLGENALAALEFAQAWLRGDQHFALHTSGSTGTPKPIALARSQMEASARATAAALGLGARDRALVCLPARYVAGRMMIVRCLVLGLTGYVVAPSSDPLALLDPHTSLDFGAFVPLQMETLLDTALVAPSDSCYAEETARSFRYRRLLEGMRAILIGGGPVSEALHNKIAALGAPVYHTYGMTETATHVALRRLNGGADRREEGAWFTPLPGVELALDHRGCLAIRGAATAGEWVQTNDLVELRPDGTFAWLGRWDNVINSGGVKVQIETVEAAVEALKLRHPEATWAGRAMAAAGLPDDRLGQVVTLVLEGEPLDAAGEAELLELLRRELDRFAVPRRFVYLRALPQTPTGKIDRRALLEALSGG
jgi:O-succinylbenzoic acid--CoA ligase